MRIFLVLAAFALSSWFFLPASEAEENRNADGKAVSEKLEHQKAETQDGKSQKAAFKEARAAYKKAAAEGDLAAKIEHAQKAFDLAD